MGLRWEYGAIIVGGAWEECGRSTVGVTQQNDIKSHLTYFEKSNKAGLNQNPENTHGLILS